MPAKFMSTGSQRISLGRRVVPQRSSLSRECVTPPRGAPDSPPCVPAPLDTVYLGLCVPCHVKTNDEGKKIMGWTGNSAAETRK